MSPIALLAVSLAGNAHADDTVDPLGPPASTDCATALPDALAAREDRSRRALVTTAVGLVAIGSGSALYREGLHRAELGTLDGGVPHGVSGALLTATGATTAAIGATVLAVRTRRLAEDLQDQGLAVSAAPGWIGLASLGLGAVALSASTSEGLDPRVAIYGSIGAAFLAGTTQYAVNRRAVRDHRHIQQRSRRSSVEVAVTPTGRGVALAGRF